MGVKYMCVVYVHDDDDVCVCVNGCEVHVCDMYMMRMCVWV